MKKLLNILVQVAAVLFLVVFLGASGYYYPVHLAFGIITAMLATSLFYLWRFTRIIMILENDLGGATQALEEVNESMQNVIDMKLFFDDPSVQELVSGVMENVRMAQFSVNNMIGHFTDRSRQKFVMLIEDEEPETPQQQAAPEQQQPPPQQQEGTIGSVRSNSSN